MKKICIIILAVFFSVLACKAKTKPGNNSQSEGDRIPDVNVSVDDLVYTAISRMDENKLQSITNDDNKAGDVSRFKNKVFIRSVDGKWTAIGVANNYDVYWPRYLANDVITVVKQAQDPNYYDARKIIIPPVYDSAGSTMAGIKLFNSTGINDGDKNMNSNVRISWVGRIGSGNVNVGGVVSPVDRFNLQPGDNFGANASYGIELYKANEQYPSSTGEQTIDQNLIDTVRSQTGIAPRYSSEENPQGHPARKWSWSYPYEHSDMPQVQFRVRVAYTHKDGTVPALTNGLETQTVFYRRYSSGGSAGENDSSAQVMATVVSKNLWITNMSMTDIFGNEKPDVIPSQDMFDKNKDKKFEILVAEFQEKVDPDPGTSSYAAAAYDGYDSILDRPSGMIIFINPQSIE